MPSGSKGSGSSAPEQSTAKTGRSAHSPRKAQGPPAMRSASAAAPVRRTASGRPSSTPFIKLRARHTGANSVSGSARAAAMKPSSSRRPEARSRGLPV